MIASFDSKCMIECKLKVTKNECYECRVVVMRFPAKQFPIIQLVSLGKYSRRDVMRMNPSHPAYCSSIAINMDETS